MIIIRLLIVLLVFLSISCETGKKKQNKNTDEIILGDYSRMIVISYDTFLVDPDIQKLDLDIDRDNINDIALTGGYVKGLPSGGSYTFSEICSLHKNALLLGYYDSDTLFLNRQTYVDSSSSGRTIISEYYNHTCHRIDVEDIILKITYDNFKILPKDKGANIKNSDAFKADTIILMKRKVAYMYTSGNNDTTIYNYDAYYNDCNTFPQDEIKYIGLKLENEKWEKLGWIKISVMDIYNILLLESAIQE